MSARGLKHPYTIALALTWAAVTHCFCGDLSVAREHAAALIKLSQEQEFPYWLGFGLMMHGWALAAQGNHKEGREQLRHGLEALQMTGTVVETRYGTTLLVDVYLMEGQITEGLATVKEVLPTVDPRGERLWDAELYRLQGELVLKHRAHQRKARLRQEAEAEGCFSRAIDIARGQQAKSWELRAVMSLARLWQQRGKKEEARRMLVEVYGWFTEGFDTADLRAAKELLDELK